MIITLCGSARFEPWFHAWNEALSLSGHSVFSLAAYPSQHDGVKSWYTLAQKDVLDAVHKRKIDASAAILVLNVFAYFGESTLGEIKHARRLGKTTYFLESWGEGCGINSSHFEHVQAARDAYGVPKDFGSPISTSTLECPSPWKLLPDAGPARSAIVSSLQRRLTAIAGGWGMQ
jgi:hypothetical protein